MNSINDIHKNPMFYYVLVPVLAAIWPGLLFFQSLPEAQAELSKEKQYAVDVNNLVQQILTQDPIRLRDPKARDTGGRTFNYNNEIDRVAKACGIRSFKVDPSRIMTDTKSGRKSQTASIQLEDVGLVRTAIFISTLLGDWTDLECTKITLTLNRNAEDDWKVDLGFSYIF